MGAGCTGIPIMFISHNSVLWSCFIINQLFVVFGMFGNVLSYRVIGYSSSRRNRSCTFYLRALAIADCSALIFMTFFMSLQMMLRPAAGLHDLHPVSLLVNYFPLCNIRLFTSYSTSLIATYIIVLFSVERCLVLADPFRWISVFSLRKARAAVLLLVLVCCLVCSPALISFVRHDYWTATASSANSSDVQELSEREAKAVCRECTNCSRDAGAEFKGRTVMCISYGMCRMDLDIFKPFALFYTIIHSAVSLVITGVCNIVIICVMRKRSADTLSQSQNSEENQDRQITKRLIMVSTVFILLNFPHILYHAVTVLMSGSYCNSWAADALTITLTLNSGNFAVNFVIYCFSEDQFRKLVVAVLKCKRHRLNRLLSYMNEPSGQRLKDQKSSTPGTASTPATSRSKQANDKKDLIEAAAPQAGEQAALISSSAVAGYVQMQQHGKKAEQPNGCEDCSLADADWSSALFAESNADQPEVARWSEVLPEGN